jgi:hypothetical protein
MASTPMGGCHGVVAPVTITMCECRLADQQRSGQSQPGKESCFHD